jgi:hypothetical protein
MGGADLSIANGRTRDDWMRVEAPATKCDSDSGTVLGGGAGEEGRACRQEYMCEFLQSEDCLLRQEDLDACLKDDLEAIF